MRRPAVQTLAVLLMALLLSGCGGIAAPPAPPTAVPAEASPPPTANLVRPTPPSEPLPCVAGRLTLGDLLAIEEEWEAGVAAATEQAQRWQADARLVQLQIGCQPLEEGYRWQGLYYSNSAQSYYFSDTGQTEPAEADPASIPSLPLDGISFQRLHVTLARGGHDDTDTFSPTSGVTVRLNAPSQPFGPPTIPEDVVYYVAVELQGEVRDLFVSEADWTIYSYRDAT
jgi:hypothetical protein